MKVELNSAVTLLFWKKKRANFLISSLDFCSDWLNIPPKSCIISSHWITRLQHCSLFIFDLCRWMKGQKFYLSVLHIPHKSGRIFIELLEELFKTPKPLKILIYRNKFNGIERESFEKHEVMLFLSSKAFCLFYSLGEILILVIVWVVFSSCY